MNAEEAARIRRRLLVEGREAGALVRERGWRRLAAVWGHGFVARQAALFDFDRFGFDAFVSEYERKRKLPRLNRDATVFRDKLLSYLFLRAIGTPSPAVYAFSDDGDVVMLGASGAGGVEGLLRRHGRLVVKPRDGAHGRGFQLLEHRDGRTLVNGRQVTGYRLPPGRMIITEHLEQHPYAGTIFPGSLNTIRAIMLRDHRTGEPFVAVAGHRFGTSRSQPVDNTGAGGLTAEIDLSTGALQQASVVVDSSVPVGSQLEWLDDHPETGARIAGTVVPHWELALQELSRAMSAMPGFAWVGWDIAITPGGVSVVEGNTGPDITFQLHRPLLLDERVRTMFEARGVLSRPARLSRRRAR